MTMVRKHWSNIGESTLTSGIWVLYALHRLFGRRIFHIVLWPIVAGFWLMQPRARQASLDYLMRMQHATGTIGHAPSVRDSLRHLFSFADTILDKLLAVSGRYDFSHVRFEGASLIEAQLARGAGGVIVTARVGCLELCRAIALRRPGMRLNVLVHTAHAERFNRILKTLSPGIMLNLIQVRDVGPATAVLLAEKVQAGEFVAIAGDRVPLDGGRTATQRFLGDDAEFPVGPYVLASVLDCPLYALGCVRTTDGHLLQFAQLADHVDLPRSRRDAALAAHAATYVTWLTALLVRSPYDWFNFYDFWATPSARTPTDP